MGDESALEVSSEKDPDEQLSDKMTSVVSTSSSLPDTQLMTIEDEKHQGPNFSQAEARASVLPLDVNLEDFDQFEEDDAVSQNQENGKEDTKNEKEKRRAKKKAMEERLIQLTYLFGSGFSEQC